MRPSDMEGVDANACVHEEVDNGHHGVVRRKG